MNEMYDELEKEVLERIIPFLCEHVGKTYIRNKEYQESAEKADLIIDKLDATLTNEQSEILERYFEQNNATIAIMEKLIYQQGIRDFLKLFIAISKEELND